MSNYKKIKMLIFCFLITSLIIVNSEAYQRHLENFKNEFQYIEYDYEDENQWQSFCKEICKLAEKNDVQIFSVVGMFDSFEKYHLKIFAEQEMQQKLYDAYEIFPGTFKSIVSGESIVEFFDVNQMINNHYIRNIYFYGTQNDINKLYNKLSVLYDISGLNECESDSHDVIVRFAWGVVGFFVILLTIFDIAFQKKEIYIKIVMGQSIWKLIIENILKDIVGLLLIFVAVNGIVGQYTYVGYNKLEVIIMAILVVVANSMVYLCMLKYNMKQVLSNGNFTESLCGTCYIIKVIIMIMAVLSFATNFIGVKNGIDFINQHKEVEKYKDYSYVELNFYNMQDEVVRDYEYYSKSLYLDNFDRYEIAYSVAMYDGLYNGKYLLINSNASDTISQLLHKYNVNTNYKVHIFIPNNCKENVEYIEEALFCADILGIDYEESYEVIYYEEEVDILYFDEDLMYSSDYAHNPIISYCTYSTKDFNENARDMLNIGHIKRNLMYKISKEDMDYLSQKYDLESKGLYLTCTNAIERYTQYKLLLEKTIITNCVISGLLFIIELGIIATIVRLEYSVNAIELAVKKVMGYSVWKRHKAILLNIILSAIIAVVLLLCMGILFELEEPYLIVLSGVCLMMVELVMTFIFIRKFEKVNIVKILKGGAL